VFLILLLLAVWGGVGVWWFMSRPEGRATDSIGSFRQQLRVLERTGPTTVAPAYRMGAPDLGIYGARRVPMSRSSQRLRMQKRRRDVFYGLLAAIGGSVLLGFMPGLTIMWGLSVLLIGVLALYVVVLVQIKNAAAPLRPASNVRYLHQPDPAYWMRQQAAN